MFLQTIKSRDGKLIHHGTVTWRNGDEFCFIPQGKRYSGEFWCKKDFWDLIEGELKFCKFIINKINT